MMLFSIFVFSALGIKGDSCVATADCEAGLHCRNHVCVDRAGQATPDAVTPPAIAPSRSEYDAYMAFRKGAEEGRYPVPDIDTWRRIPSQADWLPYFQYRKATFAANKKPVEFEAWQKKQTLGILVLTSTPPGAQVALEGRDYGLTPQRIEDLTPGTFHVTATKEGYASFDGDIVVTRGENQRALQLDDSETVQRKSVRTWRIRGGIIAGAGAGAALIIASVLFALAPSPYNDYQSFKSGFTPYTTVQADIDQHNQFVAAAGSMLGLTAALAATCVTLILTAPKVTETSVGVALLPGGVELSVRGVTW